MADEPPKPPPTPAGSAEPPPDLAPPACVTALQATLPAAVSALSYWVGDWTAIVDRAAILDVARYLRTAPGADFDVCSDVTATDWPPRAERVDVVYCL